MGSKYKYLSECRDGDKLIEEFNEEWLNYFERAIADYEESDDKDNYGDYYSDVMVWYRGLIDTDIFIADFKKGNDI